MSSAPGSTSIAGIVPRSARGGAIALIFFATLNVVAAIVLTTLFGVVFSLGLLEDWREHFDLAVWSGAVMATIALYRPGRWRRLFGLVLLVALPGALILMMERQREEGFALFFAALLLHGSINLARTLAEQARRLASPRHWIEKRLLERRCPRCLYDLRHLPGDRCPECGFDFGRSATDEHRQTRIRESRREGETKWMEIDE